MNYDAMTLGNHEFNFGKDVFTSVLGQATFPLLQANVTDDGSYGLAAANIQPYVEKTVCGDIDVAILGIGNHRIPNYELPSNIPGLTFSDPIAKAQELSPCCAPTNDVVIALTHIGFTENPPVLKWMPMWIPTWWPRPPDSMPSSAVTATLIRLGQIGFGGLYKYLPSIVADADGNPVITAGLPLQQHPGRGRPWPARPGRRQL